MLKKYIFTLATNRVGSEVKDEAELEFDDTLNEEQIEDQVNSYYGEWLSENNYGGWSEK